MKFSRILTLVAVVITVSPNVYAQPFRSVSLCSIQGDPQSFLHAHVEIHAFVVVAFEASHLESGKCSFSFSFGDYRNRFPVKRDPQWDLMKKLLTYEQSSSTTCSSIAKVVEARIRCTVEHRPATGTIPEDQMGLEIVILSVSRVKGVPQRCVPASASAVRRFWGPGLFLPAPYPEISSLGRWPRLFDGHL